MAQILEQIDLKLLGNYAFALFVLSNTLAAFGFNVMYNFADDLAKDAQVPQEVRSYIVVSLGAASIVGRFFIGFLGDRKWVQRIKLSIENSKIYFFVSLDKSNAIIHHNIDHIRNRYNHRSILWFIGLFTYLLRIAFWFLFGWICRIDCRRSF